jgi:hypothetical protein
MSKTPFQIPRQRAAQAGRWAGRTDHEVTVAAPADEMAVNAEGASRDRRVSRGLENSRYGRMYERLANELRGGV